MPDGLVRRVGARTSGPSPPARPGSSSRTAPGCARRGGRRARRRSRAAVVHHEVDPTQARQRVGERRGPGGRRRVASRRSTGRRRRRGRCGSPAPRGAAPAEAGPGRGPAPRRRADARSARATARGPPASARGAASARATRSSKSSAAASPRAPPRTRRTRARSGRPPGPRRPRRRSRRGRASGARSPCRAPASRPVRPRARCGAGRHPVDERLDRFAGVAQDLEPEGVERPDADGAGPTPSGSSAAASRSPSSSAARRVERDRGDLVRRAPPRRRPARRRGRRASSSCREPAGRDAEERAGRRGRGGALVRREPREPFGDGRVELHADVAVLARVASPPAHRDRHESGARAHRPHVVSPGVKGPLTSAYRVAVPWRCKSVRSREVADRTAAAPVPSAHRQGGARDPSSAPACQGRSCYGLSLLAGLARRAAIAAAPGPAARQGPAERPRRCSSPPTGCARTSSRSTPPRA